MKPALLRPLPTAREATRAVGANIRCVRRCLGGAIFALAAAGPITLQNHNDAVEYRNFFIKPLAD